MSANVSGPTPSVGERLRGGVGAWAAIGATLTGLALSRTIDPYLAYVASSWVIFGIVGLSLDLVWGRAGLLSLAQSAFYGIGGYVGGVTAINLAPVTGNTLLWSLPAGALGGALCAAALAIIVFYARMGPLQATILTYTFTLLVWSVSQSFKLTVGDATVGGDNGMGGIPGFVLGFGPEARALSPNGAFALVVLIAAGVYFAVRRIMGGHFGRVVDCVRLDAQKTELLGYDVRRYQTAVFVLAGAVAGIAGSLFALWSNYLNPSVFSVQEALLIPIYVLVGGLGTLGGAFVGALLIGGLSFWLGGGAIGGQTTLVLGATLVLLVLFFRAGLLGALDQLWRRFLPDRNAEAGLAAPVDIDEAVIRDLLGGGGTPPTLSTRDALKRFGGVVPVNRVSLDFGPGAPHALIGPNGAGKSSFLRLCVGMYRPDAGDVRLGDRDITHMPVFARVAHGLVVKNQKPQVFGELTVRDNLEVAAASVRRGGEATERTVDRLLDTIGMHHQSRVQASALSHGQQQWLDIGMVLALAPRVILFDEPAAGMTHEETRELSRLLRVLAEHAVVVAVEHDMEFVRTLEGRVVVLHQGERFADGDIGTLQTDERVLDIYLGRRAHVQVG